ncbi:MAG: site-specific integrase, partial [Firmicutes bacterium]|nr:site-specific integrase [Bacillota bacterium]
VKAKSQREAEKMLAEFVTEVEKGLFIAPAKLTFKEFAERWLRDYAERELAPKTVSRYKELLESRIYPAMGHLKVKDIKPMHLLEFYRNLAEDGIRLDGKPGKLSESTIRHHHRLISSILQKATEWEVIPANPARRIKAPKSKRKQAVCYDEQQVKALLAAADKEPIKRKVLIYLAVFSGLRRGEIMGLEWQDVNFEEGTISVRQAAQYVPGKGRFLKDPKNEFSKRTISLPSFVMDMLKQFKVHQAKERLKVGDLWEDSGRVFVRWDGRPLSPEWPSDWFSEFLEKHGLPHIPFHGLRHTAATLLINQGLPAKSISGRLGHSNIHTTMDIYGHWLKSADKEAAERLEQLYIGRLKNNGAAK